MKQLSTAALRYFARTYESQKCFQLLPKYHKNVFALNIFGIKQEVRHYVALVPDMIQLMWVTEGLFRRA